MAIPIGKLALYTAACGIHPALTLPVSLDVGTDNPALLADPLYLGYRAPRLRGAEYDALVEAFVAGVEEVWPGCVIQFEDFKQHNALRLLDRYRDRVPSFNDDIQGTAAVVVAGVLAALRATGRHARRRADRAGRAPAAAGIGIARLLRLRCWRGGVSEATSSRGVVLVDSQRSGPRRRTDLDATKARARACPRVDGRDARRSLETIRRVRPTVLVGTTGVAGTFTEEVVARDGRRARPDDRPIVLPLSNPTSVAEATPADILAWTDGRALVATGSPFDAVDVDGRRHEIGQANNVFIFPGVGPRRDRRRDAGHHRSDVPAGRADARRCRRPPSGWRRARCTRRSRAAGRLAAIAIAVAARRSRPALAGAPTGDDPEPPRSTARDVVAGLRPVRAGRGPRAPPRARTTHDRRRSAPPCSRRPASRPSIESSSWPSRGPARSASGCWPRASATPTCTCATASGRARRRS